MKADQIEQQLLLVTPGAEGNFSWKLQDSAGQEILRQPLLVDFEQRVFALDCQLDLPDSALSVLEKSLDHARSTSRRDFDAERGALAAAATLLAERRQFTRAEDLGDECEGWLRR